MVASRQCVLTGEYAAQSWLVAIVPFFLVNNLLLLSQYYDIQADASIDRYYIPIAYGVNRSSEVYGLITLATITTIIGYVLTNRSPMLSLIALLPMSR